jgi:hypothetical protein
MIAAGGVMPFRLVPVTLAMVFSVGIVIVKGHGVYLLFDIFYLIIDYQPS